jgi:hypothetical protein
MPLLGSVCILRARGAAIVAGTALAEDPQALALVSPVLAGGLLLKRHAPSVLLGYLLLAPLRFVLGRERAAVGWTAAAMAVAIFARVRGSHRKPLNARLLKQRLLYDRDAAPGA